MAKIASLTGGARVADVASAWDRMGYGKSRFEWAPWLYVAASVLFLLVVVERRTGWIAGAMSGRHAKMAADELSAAGRDHARPRKSIRSQMPSGDAVGASGPEPPAPAKEAAVGEGSSIFARAKQRAGSRTGHREG